MRQDHEYTILGGINRSQVGRYISVTAASISAGIVFALLAAVDLAKKFGLPANLPPSVLSLVGAAAVFSGLYAFFNKYAWRWGPLGRILKVPNINGKWVCEGQTLDANGQSSIDWSGEIVITQTWDRIRVRLTTEQSRSDSLSAALMQDEAGGFVLLYHYRNAPKVGEVQLYAHRGFAELTFSSDLKEAKGEYFNGQGRFTFGRLTLARD